MAGCSTLRSLFIVKELLIILRGGDVLSDAYFTILVLIANSMER